MHSKWKVADKYPNISKTIIQELYGLNVTGLKKSMWDIRKSMPEMFESLKREFDQEYTELNAINLTQFYHDTSPVWDFYRIVLVLIFVRKSSKSLLHGTLSNGHNQL